ncbi:SGNH/GDSL hydrolase family protein [Hymenobacter setariae]|nr:SGNH/GDSL hydrolase family protein [Hymenobacter setariae]
MFSRVYGRTIANSQVGIAVFVDGTFVGIANPTAADVEQTIPFALSGASGNHVVRFQEPLQEQGNVGDYRGTSIISIDYGQNAPAYSVVAPTVSATTIAWNSNSIGVGTGTDIPQRDGVQAVLKGLMGNTAKFISLGAGGRRISDAYPDQAACDAEMLLLAKAWQGVANPVYYLSIGVNDIPAGFSISQAAAAAGRILDTVHARYPKARVLFQTPLLVSGAVANYTEANMVPLRAAFVALANARPWVELVNGLGLLASTQKLIDGLHPSNAGAVEYATNLYTNYFGTYSESGNGAIFDEDNSSLRFPDGGYTVENSTLYINGRGYSTQEVDKRARVKFYNPTPFKMAASYPLAADKGGALLTLIDRTSQEAVLNVNLKQSLPLGSTSQPSAQRYVSANTYPAGHYELIFQSNPAIATRKISFDQCRVVDPSTPSIGGEEVVYDITFNTLQHAPLDGQDNWTDYTPNKDQYLVTSTGLTLKAGSSFDANPRGALYNYQFLNGEIRVRLNKLIPTVMIRARHQLSTDRCLAFWCRFDDVAKKFVFDAGVIQGTSVAVLSPTVGPYMPTVGVDDFIMAFKLVGNQVELRAYSQFAPYPETASYTTTLPDDYNLPAGLVGICALSYEAEAYEFVLFA